MFVHIYTMLVCVKNVIIAVDYAVYVVTCMRAVFFGFDGNSYFFFQFAHC